MNYRCNAACRHCLYACSPGRRPGYVSKEKIREICGLLVKGHIGSVHIGGGEPFLDFPGLITVIRELARSGIQLDYIETNAFWAQAHDPVVSEKLEILKKEGASALCISVDPFHAEHIPYDYPLNLARSCAKCGMDYFLWKGEFLEPLSRLEHNKTHSRSELEKELSPDYIIKTARAYGIHLGGRAVNIEEEYGPLHEVSELLDDEPCGDLLSTGHFHVDLDGCFIPPGCTGIRLPLEDLIEGMETGRYRVFDALLEGGISALYNLARQFQFRENQKYPSKCNLCFHIRKYLSDKGFEELDEDFYTEALKYY